MLCRSRGKRLKDKHKDFHQNMQPQRMLKQGLKTGTVLEFCNIIAREQTIYRIFR